MTILWFLSNRVSPNILNFQGYYFIAILDDDAPKKYLKRLIPERQECVIGTVGFFEICSGNYPVFEKNEAALILISIKKSKFRIEDKIIDEVIQRVSGQML